MPEVIKTLKDCAACPVVTKCDAHNTRGGWKHRAGVLPCRVSEIAPIIEVS